MPRMLQVRNVPDRVHRILRQRAARHGKSLSTFVLQELERMAEEVPLDEWLDEIHRHPPTHIRSKPAALVRRERNAR